MAKTLLLADDSVTIQKVVGIAFASEDVDLVTVDNGDDAVARAREVRPDVVLADVVMPGKNGYEVCEALKADPALQHVPVLLLTGTFEAFDEDRARRAGAAGHVAKPFEAQVLVERVLTMLSAPPPAPPAPAQAPAAPAARPTQTPPVAAASTPPVAGPATTPPAAAAPPQAAAPAAESFDFFDDDLGDLSAPAPAAGPATTPPMGDDDLQLDNSDNAFAFGDDDLAPRGPDPGVAPTPVPPPPDSTVAIMPDEPAPRAAAPMPGPTELDPSLGLPASGEEDTDDLLSADLGSPVAPATGGAEAFDFEMADGDAGRAPDLGSANDLASATVLDPKGASGFDVSYSDLGAPAASPPPASPAVAQSPPQAAPERPSAPAEEALPSPGAAPSPPPAPAAMPEPPAVAAPPRPPRPAPEPAAAPGWSDEPEFAESPRPFGAAGPPAPAPVHDAPTPHPAAARSAAPEPDPLFDAIDEAVPEPELADSSLEDSFEQASGGAQRRAPSGEDHDPSALAGMALAEVTPKLREQLHDTLEKIAWDSMGNVAEQIVRQAVERVEQIAWEVIPPMAETLIREEIRRMKGEDSE